MNGFEKSALVWLTWLGIASLFLPGLLALLWENWVEGKESVEKRPDQTIYPEPKTSRDQQGSKAA